MFGIYNLKARVGPIRRSSIVRKLENFLRFSGKRFVSLGDTNSSFYRPGWETVDLINADHIIDFRKEKLPFRNETIDVIHLSHVIEHISYEDGLRLFEEIYRCLKPGGCCRFSTPDMDLLLERYRDANWRFFLQADGNYILSRVCKADLPPESLLIHNRLVGWFASYSGRLDTGGGPVVDKQLIEEKLATLSKYEFRDWCVSLLQQDRIHAHIHLYDYEELRHSLEKAGFQKIRKVSFGESDCQYMINPSIDILKHKIYSLYVEAIK
ncbi:hypothetical protein NUACC21_82380 [Scytonema sp. NUACC21]